MAKPLFAFLAAIGIITFLGFELAEACSCFPTDDPVCGEDGVTYKNGCYLFCHNWDLEQQHKPTIKTKCQGTCECCDPKPCGCNRCYDPVCGENNVTYPNPCILDCENRKRKCQGLAVIEVRCKKACEHCPLPCCCSKKYEPVCGEDNVTYNNICLLNCKNKKRKSQGLPIIGTRCKKPCKDCELQKGCNCKCISNYDPVCGTDGKTYTNQCWLDCINKWRKKKGLPNICIKCRSACRGCPPEEPCICPAVSMPVCGSDGVTYYNVCFLNCENKKRKKKGLSEIHLCCKKNCKKCRKCRSCTCSKIYAPVCGSDNATYGNLCAFDWENRYRKKHSMPKITLVCKRPCKECVSERCDCPKIYQPVCGTDGKTYDNICLLECKNKIRHNQHLPSIKVRCNTKCKHWSPSNGCVCAADYDPVCGTDGQTYSNRCWLNCANKKRKKKYLPPIGIKCEDECKYCQKPKPCVCPPIYAPICGTDGKTYANECFFEFENEIRKKKGLPEIRICCKNKCKKCPQCIGCICPHIYRPICGSDGNTYPNICEFDCENKFRVKNGKPKITIRCQRTCDACLNEECHCSDKYAPVCGTDGKTHINMCFFQLQNTIRHNLDLPRIAIKCLKACKDCHQPHNGCICPEVHDPVCGSDGITYSNKCWLECINRTRKTNRQPVIEIKCYDDCKYCHEHKTDLCHDIFAPVCGTNGKTYNNECLLAVENRKLKRKCLPEIRVCCKKKCKDCSECTGPICPPIYNPICGSDGKTYGNICEYNRENKFREVHRISRITIRCFRPCEECLNEKCLCSNVRLPVCGTDGNTYDNICFFEFENVRRYNRNLPRIEMKCKKECKNCNPPKVEYICPHVYDPVCGLNGKTYSNQCWLDSSNKYRKRKGLTHIGIKCKDECKYCYKYEPCDCTSIYAPICGTDGKTYGNTCLLSYENEKRKKKGLPPINVCSYKDCKKCPECTVHKCLPIYFPICGSDGYTYGNTCEFDHANKFLETHGKPKITIRCRRPCDLCLKDTCHLCPKVYAPVCGTDGKTYNNECLLVSESIKRINQNLPPIKIKCKKPCKDCIETKKCDCTDIYKPVCGLDGKTYTNMCWLDYTNANRKKLGLPPIGIKCKTACNKCVKEICECPKIISPVCGSDGTTYNNLCLFERENKIRCTKKLPPIQIKCKKPCKDCPEPKKCDCTDIYKPVCGLDGKTYTNICWLDYTNAQRKKLGLPPIGIKCKTACNKCVKEIYECPKTISPVCGSDGITYNNLCLFERENKIRCTKKLPPIQIKCKKPCKDCPEPKKCDCTDIYKPVCGLDGKTYTNICWLDYTNAQRKKLGLPPIGIKCKTACNKCVKEIYECPKTISPVCGSDGITYNNLCLFERENKIRCTKKLPPIQIKCKKPCKDCPEPKKCDCTDIYKPVCGLDGKTYTNICWLDYTNAQRKKLGLPPIGIKCKTACNKCVKEIYECPKTISPVCGSDGITYNNLCLFERENKIRCTKKLPPIQIKCKKPCKDCPEPKKCDCTDIYKPLCGLDGKTYTNICWLDYTNAHRKKLGLPPIGIKCKTACNKCVKEIYECPKTISPVCGSDGITYNNLCLFERENKIRCTKKLPPIQIKCKKPCKDCPEPKKCDCTDIYKPVCGLDGKTYTNICWLDYTNALRKKLGLPPIGIKCKTACRGCPPVHSCPLVITPVCGSNGITYDNACLLIHENTKRKIKGLSQIHLCCKRDCKYCPDCRGCPCPKIYSPVCGSDKATYGNLCSFNCENKYRKTHGLPELTLTCKRACNECVSEVCDCPKIYSPVCGTDGKTYGNMCLFKCENKKRHNQNLPSIEIRCKRDCKVCEEEKKRCTCNCTLSPVCGSDNVTYSNDCLRDCENFHREQDGRPKVTVLCKKPCDQCQKEVCNCTKIKSPVCGSNNKTYSNICLFECENRKRCDKNLKPLTIRCKHDCKVCDEEQKRCVGHLILDPVCGSDNVTYSNYYQLDCENFHREQDGRPKIAVRCKRPCDKCKNIDNDCNCTKIYSPVCGTDNKTYNNMCGLECENKKRYNNNLLPINVRCKLDCKYCDEEKKRCSCDGEKNFSICGTDGVSYTNFCTLNCGNFHRKVKGLPAIDVVCTNVCDLCNNECECGDSAAPVCTTDGKTYPNRCEVGCANRLRADDGRPLLKIACESTCKACSIKKKS